jgi:hypothetical protein
MTELHLIDDHQAETLSGGGGGFSFKSNDIWVFQKNDAANIAIGGPAAIFNLQANFAEVFAANVA